MIRLYSINNKIRYDVDHYVVDNMEALKTLVPSNMGDTAYVINTFETYMADSALDWYRIIPKRTPSPPPEDETTVAVLSKAILGRFAKGILNDCKIYNYALSDEQIEAFLLA